MTAASTGFERFDPDGPDPDDPFDVRIAVDATGSLREFNAAGVLNAADVHVAERLGRLGGESNDDVRLAIALTVRGVRSGSVCVDLDLLRHQWTALEPALPWPDPAAWSVAVRDSPLVGDGKPLRLEHGLLYLDRYRRQEEQVYRDLLARESQPPPDVDSSALALGLERLFPGSDAEQQRAAARAAATQWTTVLGGGPGTGKTTTVARVISLLMTQPGPPLRVAMAAPTGKAAARLQAAVQHEATRFDPADRHDLPELTASTLHRLLGWVPGRGTRFRHNRDNRLPFDLVVVDETSMVSLTMMARLLEAVRPDARLLLVGDPDQLASVEAGAVLADLVAGLTARDVAAGAPTDSSGAASGPEVGSGRRSVVLLRKTWRFGGDIADLASAVRDGDADAAVAVLHRGGTAVLLVPPDEPGIRRDVLEAATAVRAAAVAGDALTALERLDAHRLLCAHRSGPRGVQEWTRRIEDWLADIDHDVTEGEWYAGRPVLITANDYALGLFNGDTGVAVRDADASLRVMFGRERDMAGFAPRRLAEAQTVHAMTVHRSQGSQFHRVTFVLPEADSPLSTRELLYTALTRAEVFVRLVGSEAEFRAAISRPAARASGLRLRLAQTTG
ncbi:exodeoxyribonuclease V subunit alpha [Nakamurella sp. GG22]